MRQRSVRVFPVAVLVVSFVVRRKVTGAKPELIIIAEPEPSMVRPAFPNTSGSPVSIVRLAAPPR